MSRRLLIGVVVHTDTPALHATLDALAGATRESDHVVLVPDGPDAAMAAALRTDPRLGALAQRGVAAAQGNASAFNRIAAAVPEGVGAIVFLENGARPAPEALDRLARALDEPGVGIAGPSTNDAWNEQGALADGRGDPGGLREGADELRGRFGDEVRSLAPLHSIAEVCIAVSIETLAAVGAADEGFGAGPCWEMEYAARAARVGRPAVWVGAAYVHRAPPTARRRRLDLDGLVAARHRYQDRLCGLRLDGSRPGYAPHCQGDACAQFAPPQRIVVRLPLAGESGARPLDVATTPVTAVPPGPPASGASVVPAASVVSSASPTAAAPPARCAATAPARSPLSVRAPGPPLVSCLMPTADRRDWVAQAIGYFHGQDHPAKQLVIVDDGATGLDGQIGPLLEHPSIVYVREPQRRSIGAKRNLACLWATGEVLIQWDDDDWYGPARISTQLAPIVAGTADITGLRDAVWFDVDAWRFRRPMAELHRRLFIEDVHGGTLAFRRDVWERGTRYPDLSLAEDASFLGQAVRRGSRLVTLPSAGHYLYVRHGTNSWRLRPEHEGAGGWETVDEPAALGAARAFYAARAPTRSRVAPTVRDPSRPSTRSSGRSSPGGERTPVTCIMPTADRRHFVPTAIASFQAQRYEDAELLILDDGYDPIGDLVPDDPRVRYLRLDGRRTLGEKRNLAVEAATGQVIVHFDDDDRSHPDRIGVQVDALNGGAAELCGLNRMLWWDPRRAAAWRYTCPRVQRPWVAGNTLAYLRSTWERSPFPRQALGEDTAFVWGRLDRRVLPIDDERLVIGTLHASNTSTKHTHGAAWTAVDVGLVRNLIEGVSER